MNNMSAIDQTEKSINLSEIGLAHEQNSEMTLNCQSSS